jgi:2'-5' RNA ligase
MSVVRLFVAVEIGSEVQASATRVIEDLKRRTEQSAPHARVTWVKPEQLHLTVRFIGQADPNLCQTILTTLAHPLPVSAFELTIEGTGSFPPERPPRVIWAGITAGLDQLHAVEREVRSRLGNRSLVSGGSGHGQADKAVGLTQDEHWRNHRHKRVPGVDPLIPAGDERDYRPHLTLGRVKIPAGFRPAVVLKGLEQAVFGRVRVEAVTLFESRLSSAGPTYVALGRTPLTRTL